MPRGKGYRLTCTACDVDRQFDHLKYAELAAEIHQLRSRDHVVHVEPVRKRVVAVGD